MCLNANTLFKLSFLSLSLSASLLFSQSPTSSPYSRFGIGEMEKRGFGQINALGGTHIAMESDTIAPLFINSGNPASYPSVRLTTFEVGVQNNFSTFVSNSASVKKNNTSLNYMALAFPVGKRAGGAFGVTPYTNVGYSITSQSEVSGIGTVKELYEGSGGANQLFLGFGIRPFSGAEYKFMHSEKYKALRTAGEWKKIKSKKYLKHTLGTLSVGANANYMFGTISHSGVLIYPSGVGVYNTKRVTEARISDFNGNGGIQFSFDVDSVGYTRRDSVRDDAGNISVVKTRAKRDMKKNVRFTLGYNVTMPRAIGATASTIATTFIYGPFQHEYVQDTVLNNSNVKGKITLPLFHGIGFCFKKGDNLTLLGDIEMQVWSGYKYMNETNTFKNAMRYSMGVQYVPDRLAQVARGSYFKRVQYRMGVRYTDGYLELKNTKVADYAVTAGLGLPMGRYKLLSTLNLSVEYGKAGTLQNNLIQQNYIRAVIGFTFNDRWFIKTKYD
jgi:hypothetical protein